MVRFDSLSLLAEEYTYMYQSVRDPLKLNIDEAINYFTTHIFELDHNYEELGHDTYYNMRDRIHNIQGKVLYFWLKIFHEAEYKRNVLAKYGINTSDLDITITKIFELFKIIYNNVRDVYMGAHESMANDPDLPHYKQIDDGLSLLKNAKTLNKQIIAVTICLNIVHESGNLLEDYFGLSKTQLDDLSNLPKKQWDRELYKEFGIKIASNAF